MNRNQAGRHSANERRMSGITLARDRRSSSSSANTAGVSNKPSPEEDDGHVKVAVRCRPMSEKELKDGHESIVEFESDKRLVVHDVSESPSDQLGTASGERRNISHVYDFDRVFKPDSSQLDIYDKVCRPIVSSVLAGYNGTIFAYGQTGTGKTYTMEGLRDVGRRKSSADNNNNNSNNLNEDVTQRNNSLPSNDCENDSQPISDLPPSAGIIPRTFEQIFDHIRRCRDVQFLVRASYLEIYQEEIRDLLKRDRNIKLELHERTDIGVYVKDLTSFVCKSVGEIERVMRVGNQNRIVGATDMNEHSSRSHAIFMITIEQQPLVGQLTNGQSDQWSGRATVTSGAGATNESNGVIKVGKLNLVDLAGSERQRKTNSHGQRQQESIKINLSLSALGNVINSLMKLHSRERQQQSNKSAPWALIHTPYRDSKLTRLLQDSLGGNAKTLMIANIGPASYNYDETINTLNYASRARCIRNKPRLNEDPKDALLRELQREIAQLRARLSSTNGPSKSKQATGPNESLRLDDRLIESEFLELKQKLASLECKLLNGDKNDNNNNNNNNINTDNNDASSKTSTIAGGLSSDLLAGYTQRQELELSRRRNELDSQYGRQKAIQDELERREEAELLAKQSFVSIQQEVDSKKKLIRQILFKAKAVHDKLGETQRACRLELDDLDQLQYVLQKELKLKCLVMDNFIPNNHVDQLLPRILYDERRNCCSISPLIMAMDHHCMPPATANGHQDQDHDYQDYWRPVGNSIRPRSEFERISEAIYPGNIRYKYENLIEFRLELMPTLNDDRDLILEDTESGGGGGPTQTPNNNLQSLITKALNEREPDIVI